MNKTQKNGQNFKLPILTINKELPLQMGNSEFEATEIQFIFRNILKFCIRFRLAFLVLCLLFTVLTELFCIEYPHSTCYKCFDVILVTDDSKGFLICFLNAKKKK